MRSKLSIIILGCERYMNVGEFVGNIDSKILMNSVFIIFKPSTQPIFC